MIYKSTPYLKEIGKSIIFYQTLPRTPHPNSLFPEKDLSLILWEIGPQVGETNFTHGSNPPKKFVRSLIDKHILLLGKYTMINCWQYRLCKGCLSWLPSGRPPPADTKAPSHHLSDDFAQNKAKSWAKVSPVVTHHQILSCLHQFKLLCLGQCSLRFANNS